MASIDKRNICRQAVRTCLADLQTFNAKIDNGGYRLGGSMLAGAKGREMVLAMPKDRILVETDAPFRVDDALAAQQSICELKNIGPSAMRDNLWKVFGPLP